MGFYGVSSQVDRLAGALEPTTGRGFDRRPSGSSVRRLRGTIEEHGPSQLILFSKTDKT